MVEAGRDLDARVAERVFKWRPLFAQDGRVRELWPPEADPFAPVPDWSRCAEPPDWGYIPYYSTSISDAWRVVVKMTDRMGPENPEFIWEGPLFKPVQKDLQIEHCPVEAACWYISFQLREGERRIVCAETAPLAVCLAALQIVES